MWRKSWILQLLTSSNWQWKFLSFFTPQKPQQFYLLLSFQHQLGVNTVKIFWQESTQNFGHEKLWLIHKSEKWRESFQLNREIIPNYSTSNIHLAYPTTMRLYANDDECGWDELHLCLKEKELRREWGDEEVRK